MKRRWQALRIARTRQDLTQQELANLVGASEPKIAKLETLRQLPTAEELSRISEALGVTVEELAADLPATQRIP